MQETAGRAHTAQLIRSRAGDIGEGKTVKGSGKSSQ